jgi:hypothetical protein
MMMPSALFILDVECSVFSSYTYLSLVEPSNSLHCAIIRGPLGMASTTAHDCQNYAEIVFSETLDTIDKFVSKDLDVC